MPGRFFIRCPLRLPFPFLSAKACSEIKTDFVVHRPDGVHVAYMQGLVLQVAYYQAPTGGDRFTASLASSLPLQRATFLTPRSHSSGEGKLRVVQSAGWAGWWVAKFPLGSGDPSVSRHRQTV